MAILSIIALAVAALQAQGVLGFQPDSRLMARDGNVEYGPDYRLKARDGNEQFPYCTYDPSKPDRCIVGGKYVKPDLNISEIGSPGANAYNTYLPTHSYSLSLWTNGKMPFRCSEKINNNGFSPSDFTVYNVTYDDCSAPWVICRSNVAFQTIQELAVEISRIPAGMRQGASTYVVLPETISYLIQSWSDQGVIDGKGSLYHATGLVHEHGHAVDGALLVTPGNGFYSGTSTWKNIVEADGYAATAYGTSTHQEGFTDIGRVVLIENIYPGGINGLFPNHPNLTRIAGQIAHFQSVAGAYYETGTTCDLTKKFAFPTDLVDVAPPPVTTPTSTATATPYGQCGGAVTYTGPTLCGPGWGCTTLNPYYAQCTPTPAPAKRDFREFSA